jgi:hypothetical protein
MKLPLDPLLVIEAKALTALAFRNSPIEDLHAGQVAPSVPASRSSLTSRTKR